MKYKAILSDLDGTLLDKAGNISRENLEAIKKITDMGVRFAVATGRTVCEIPNELLENDCIDHIMFSNGVAHLDPKTKSYTINEIKKPAIRELFKVLDGVDCITITHADCVCYADKDKSEINAIRRYGTSVTLMELINSFVTGVDDVREISFDENSHVEMITTYYHSEEDYQRCARLLEKIEGISITCSAGLNTEAIPKGLNKGTALQEYSEMTGIGIDEIIAVGDSMNDLPMVKIAGLGLATEDAADGLKREADMVICDNSKHIANFILQNILK